MAVSSAFQAQKCEKMLTLLSDLEHDLVEDISEASHDAFKYRVNIQFQKYEEIADLRTSLKKETLEGDVAALRKKCTVAYKNFIQNMPAFRVAHEIKISSLLDHNAKEDGRADAVIHKCKTDWHWDSRIPLMLFREVNLQKINLKSGESHLVNRFRWNLQWKPIWRKVQKLILEGYQRARSIQISSMPTLTWTTGTSTATLVCLLRMQAQEIGCPALIPSGKFGQYFIAPLAGELEEGTWRVYGISVGCLSGCSFPAIYSSLTYAPKKGSFTIANELQCIKDYNKRCPYGFLATTILEEIAILRLLFAKAQKTPGSEEAVQEAKTELTEALKKYPPTGRSFTPYELSQIEHHQKTIANLIHQIENPSDRFQKMTNEERSIAEHASGIVFGSYSLTGSFVKTNCNGECAIKGPLKLGKDIQVAFVHEKKLEQIRAYMLNFPKDSQIPVVSWKALYYLTASTSPSTS